VWHRPGLNLHQNTVCREHINFSVTSCVPRSLLWTRFKLQILTFYCKPLTFRKLLCCFSLGQHSSGAPPSCREVQLGNYSNCYPPPALKAKSQLNNRSRPSSGIYNAVMQAATISTSKEKETNGRNTARSRKDNTHPVTSRRHRQGCRR
jgi:hypothetical protein